MIHILKKAVAAAVIPIKIDALSSFNKHCPNILESISLVAMALMRVAEDCDPELPEASLIDDVTESDVVKANVIIEETKILVAVFVL